MRSHHCYCHGIGRLACQTTCDSLASLHATACVLRRPHCRVDSTTIRTAYFLGEPSKLGVSVPYVNCYAGTAAGATGSHGLISQQVSGHRAWPSPSLPPGPMPEPPPAPARGGAIPRL